MDIKHSIIVFISIMLSYFIGAIPFGYVVAKLVKGIDIRQHGSNNIGATNVARVLGTPYFFVVFILDALKGFAPVFFITPIAYADVKCAICVSTLYVSCATFALVGHIFPVYLKFKGGKGVATAAGIIFALNYMAGLIALGVWLVIFVIFGYVSLASIVAAIALPIAQILSDVSALGNRLPVTIFCILAGVIVIIRHRTNIKRLLQGTESRILWQKKKSS